MKEILLTVKRQKTEIRLFGVCLLAAFLMNVCAIIAFGTEWKELYTQLLWVLSISVFFYVLLLVFRLLYWVVRNWIRKK